MRPIEIRKKLSVLNSKDELREIISQLKIVASNRRSDENIIHIIEDSIGVATEIKDFESLVILKGLLILQYIQQSTNMEKSIRILEKMQSLATKIDYKEGLAFSFSFAWYIARIRGNKEERRESIISAVTLLDEVNQPNQFIYYFVKYTQALEMWFVSRDIRCVDILENCIVYFSEKRLYHSLVMSLGILSLIFQQTQNKEKAINLTKTILMRRNFLNQVPEEIRSNIHFFIGFSQELSFSLNVAEKHLKEAIRILQPIYETSIYSSYYLTALSYLTATYALQGKLELAYNQIIEVDELIEEGIATRNLDDFNRGQMKHIFDLTKFYILSRLRNFAPKNLYELKQKILENISKYYSNAIFFSEFLLNAELTKEQLIEIKDLKTPSTKRIEHILNFLIERAIITNEQDLINSIFELKRRPAKKRMTYEEKAFADLLAAQEYYKIRRFSEIYPLLKKYKNNLNRIEVLELRIFMEAFIQISAFKNGDPMGLALQYVAIRKCQQYGFSGLENKLLSYLELQRKDVVKALF
ncbi:MAG: hypothetical protein GOP50_06215 [Candidatus Heimdallarchaeota archaeon]|nr:hypothetical protein [Candidatus Heimdallarchaeota archaeon]